MKNKTVGSENFVKPMHKIHSFSDFLKDPVVSLSFIVIALIALVMAILDFRRAIS